MKNKKILLFFLLITSVIMLTGCNQKNREDNTKESAIQNANNQNLMSEVEQIADKVEVVHFHATQQCWSCITVGEYALKVIKEKFPEEYKNGIITFKDINGELIENKDIVIKYQASGSSLFVNAITDGRDKIEEDVRVWRLVSNEMQFINYFENKLKTLLGK